MACNVALMSLPIFLLCFAIRCDPFSSLPRSKPLRLRLRKEVAICGRFYFSPCNVFSFVYRGLREVNASLRMASRKSKTVHLVGVCPVEAR